MKVESRKSKVESVNKKRLQAPKFIYGKLEKFVPRLITTRHNNSLFQAPKFIYGVITFDFLLSTFDFFVDRRFAAPFFVGYCRRAKVFDRRFLNYAESDFQSREALVASCLLSCHLVMLWSNFPERTILRLLSKAMKAPWLDKKHQFEECPDWLKLSGLSTPTLVEFKNLLILEIEEWLIVRVDPDPEVFDMTILSSGVGSITSEMVRSHSN